jgi:hypothetical protein
MDRAAIETSRAELQGILDQIKAGLETLAEDESGQLRRDTTPATRASLERRIAEYDRKLAELDRA